jgi:hypothetical protein
MWRAQGATFTVNQGTGEASPQTDEPIAGPAAPVGAVPSPRPDPLGDSAVCEGHRGEGAAPTVHSRRKRLTHL